MAKPSMLRVDSLEYLKLDMTENSTAKMVCILINVYF